MIQRRVPLVERPFEAIGAALEPKSSEGEVIASIEQLRAQGIIREISGIFDATALGYRQALATFEVEPSQLDRAGRIVSEHPGVSHCYGRGGRFNLWFTLAVSPTSGLGLEGTVSALASACGAAKWLILPTIKRYKLQVELVREESASEGSSVSEDFLPVDARIVGATELSAGAAAMVRLSDEQRRAIGALQIDLPARTEAFGPLARQAGITVRRLLAHGEEFLAEGLMRRYAAVLHHRAAGAQTNVLVAWNVTAGQADVVGPVCGRFAAVSHCYLRPTAAQWPYSLYTMIHGGSEEECRATIAAIAAATGVEDRAELWTTAEYKKKRMRLFSDDERAWEEAQGR